MLEVRNNFAIGYQSQISVLFCTIIKLSVSYNYIFIHTIFLTVFCDFATNMSALDLRLRNNGEALSPADSRY